MRVEAINQLVSTPLTELLELKLRGIKAAADAT